MKRRLVVLPLLCALIASGCDASGDRVLVGKFLYDSGIAPPRRYDVVVFKFPERPVENGTPKNYIKRLLGLPGEIIAIFFGRLFRFAFDGPGAPAGISEEEWRKLTDPSKLDPQVPDLELWQHPQKDSPIAQKLWDLGQFKILRKPPTVMLALSRPVFDNDYQPKDTAGILPDRWAPQAGSNWVAVSGPNGFTHPGTGAGEQWLRYRHILRPSNWPARTDPNYKTTLDQIKTHTHKPQLITDFLGYNSYETNSPPRSEPNWVGDLMLECKLSVQQPKGEFRMELSKGVDRFQARFNLETGVCSLMRNSNHKKKGDALDWQLLATAETRVKSAGDYVIRFANYDERLTLWVGRDLPFDEGHEYPSPTEHGPDAVEDPDQNNDLQPASLGSVGAAVQVHNLKLWRDTYYTGNPGLADAKPNVVGDDWGNPAARHDGRLVWDALRHLTPRTIYVYPGHYLCLGDNSPESSDGRQWGLVPERLMLGRALVVYFPFERAGTIK